MRPENEARLRKIERISRVLRWICKGFLVLAVWIELLTLSAVVLGRGGLILGLDNYTFFAQEMPIGSRIIVGAYLTLRWAAFFLCVYCLHQLLGNYSRGEIFSGDSAMQIRRCGLACVLWGAVQFLWVFVPGAVLPHVAPVSHYGHISVYGPEVKALPGDWIINGRFVQPHGGGMMVIGLAIVAISWFMAMAAEMREEQDLIV